jgi:hypothetical protein
MRNILIVTLSAAMMAASLQADAGGGHGHHGRAVHSHARVGIYFGAPIAIGGWWGPRPYPSFYAPYPYYYAPAPVVVREVVREPLVFYDERGNPVPPAQPQARAPSPPAAAPTWFYCADSQSYYPYVETCASPWQRVVPHPPPQ